MILPPNDPRRNKVPKVTNAEFLRAAFGPLAAEQYGWWAAFKGYPEDGGHRHWYGSPWTAATLERDLAIWNSSSSIAVPYNTFYVVSTFKGVTENRRGQLKPSRRKSTHCALFILGIDDVGTKVDPAAPRLPPSAVIETSPENFHVLYFLSVPITDEPTASAFIDVFQSAGLGLDHDPGSKGVTRYLRLPVGQNMKPAYGGNFPHRLAVWRPELRYSPAEIAEAHGFTMEEVLDTRTPSTGSDIPPNEDPFLSALAAEGRLLNQAPNPQGNGSVAYHVLCPWADEHSPPVESGAAYFTGGGFKCHHGSCQDRGFPALIDWLDERGYDVWPMQVMLEEYAIQAHQRGYEQFWEAAHG